MPPRAASMRSRICALACGVALLALAAPIARAQRTSSLSWVRLSGSESCISTQALAERVEQRIGRRAFVSASQADLSLEAHVERVTKPSGFVATLVVSDRKGRVLGRRVLRVEGERCEDLDASLVLVIAIAIDPGATLPAVLGPEQDLSPEAKAMLAQLGLPELSEQQLRDELAVSEPDAERPVVAAKRPAPLARPSSDGAALASPGDHEDRVRLRVGIGASGELGVLPDPGFGAALELTILAPRFWPIDIWIAALLDQRIELEAGQAAGRFRVWTAGLALCPLVAGRTLELRACAGARGGALSGQGSGFAQTLARTGPLLEATLYPGVRLALAGSWSLCSQIALGIPVVRDTFQYQDRLGQRHRVHRAAAVTGRLEIGTDVSF